MMEMAMKAMVRQHCYVYYYKLLQHQLHKHCHPHLCS
jgi:hypothetical protein